MTEDTSKVGKNRETMLHELNVIHTTILGMQNEQGELKKGLLVLHYSLLNAKKVLETLEETPIEEIIFNWEKIPGKITTQEAEFSEKKQTLKTSLETENEALADLIDLDLPTEEKYKIFLETLSDETVNKLKESILNSSGLPSELKSKIPKKDHRWNLSRLLGTTPLTQTTSLKDLSLEDEIDFPRTQKLTVSNDTFPISHEQLVALGVKFVMETDNTSLAYICSVNKVTHIQKELNQSQLAHQVWQKNKNGNAFSFGGATSLYLLYGKEEDEKS